MGPLSEQCTNGPKHRYRGAHFAQPHRRVPVMLITAEMLIDVVIEARVTAICAAAAGAIGWALFRKNRPRLERRASARAGSGLRRSGYCRLRECDGRIGCVPSSGLAGRCQRAFVCPRKGSHRTPRWSKVDSNSRSHVPSKRDAGTISCALGRWCDGWCGAPFRVRSVHGGTGSSNPLCSSAEFRREPSPESRGRYPQR